MAKNTDKADLKKLVASRDAMLKILKAKNVSTEKFQKEVDDILQDFAVKCVQVQSEDLGG